MKAALAGLVYFLLVFAAGFALGMVRVPLVVPMFGVRWAELLEMPIMLLAIVLSCRWLLKRFSIVDVTPALACGLVALVLLVLAELIVAMTLTQLSPADYLASRDPVSGSAYMLMLVVFAAMPLWMVLRKNEGVR